MKRLFRALLFGPKNNADTMVLMSVLGVLTFLGLSIYHTLAKGDFDAQSFGIGLGSVLGAASIGLGTKTKLEHHLEPPAGT